MPRTPIHLYRLSFGGTLFETETWACTMHIESTVFDAAMPAAFQTAIKNVVESPVARVSGGVELEWIKFNEIDPPTNNYLSETTANTFFYPTALMSGAMKSPAQVSVAVSLRTALTRGRAHAGRVFPPTSVTDGSMGSDGLLTESAANDIAGAWATCVSAINAVAGGRVVVWSHVGQIVEDVTAVRVGRVPDTQQRRREALPEKPTAPVAVTP